MNCLVKEFFMDLEKPDPFLCPPTKLFSVAHCWSRHAKEYKVVSSHAKGYKVVNKTGIFVSQMKGWINYG